MARTTREDLEKRAETIGDRIGEEVHVSATANGKRFEIVVGQSGRKNLSPRLPAGDLNRWGWAFLKGVRYGRR